MFVSCRRRRRLIAAACCCCRGRLLLLLTTQTADEHIGHPCAQTADRCPGEFGRGGGSDGRDAALIIVVFFICIALAHMFSIVEASGRRLSRFAQGGLKMAIFIKIFLFSYYSLLKFHIPVPRPEV